MMGHMVMENEKKIARIPKKTENTGKRITVKAIFLDLDGTVHLDGKIIDGVSEVIKKLRTMGMQIFFWTNNSSKSRKEIMEKLKVMDIDAEEEFIYSSGYALAQYVKERLPGMSVYCISDGGIQAELTASGILVSENQTADIVAVGLDRTFSYTKLEHANNALEKGAIFIATNQDETIPTPEGPKPGAGSIVAALAKASGKIPYLIGKPSPYMLNLALKEHKIKKTEAIIVGDKLDTDILAAKKAGIASVLVLTGVTKKQDVKMNKKIKPDFVINSLKDIPRILSNRG